MLTDTIVAEATPPGSGALAIVRLTGPRALAIAGAVFHPRGRLDRLASHACRVGYVRDGEETIDQVVATVFRAPRSFTGEEMVELTCHGGPVVVGRLLELLRSAGARSACPGEFTQRAFVAGKLDLAQAEAVAALIAARSTGGARAAQRVLHGELSRSLGRCLDRLTECRVRIEAALDVQEDGAADVLADAAGPGADDLICLLDGEIERLRGLSEGGRTARLMQEGARVVLIGRPNAGKSSLFNALLARDRAIVSPEPGTTRDALEARAEWEGVAIDLVDTAGLGRGAGAIEREGVRRALEAAEGAALAVLVVDAGVATPADLPVLEAETQLAPQRLLVVAHKWDLSGDRWPSDSGGRCLRSSVVGRPGVEEVRTGILARLRSLLGDESEALLVSDRQRESIARALAATERGRELLAGGAGGELVAAEVREAAEAVASVLGRRADALLLEGIFSRFCVGK